MESMKLELNNVTHRYGKGKEALTNVSLTLEKGITGFLGVNGAGKSTLLNIIATSFKPTIGSYTFNGIDALNDPFAVRKALGYLPQHIGFLPELTVKDYISYMSMMKGCDSKYLKKAIPHFLECFNLLPQMNKPISSLSGGMKQRIGIIQAIITEPKLLILDEPIIGLDPNERNNFNALISDLAKDTIVLISSHIIDDIENICENVALLNQGKLMFHGQTNEILSSIKNFVHEKTITREEYDRIKLETKIIRMKPMGTGLKIRYISDQRNDQFWVEPSLEDAFIYNTKITG